MSMNSSTGFKKRSLLRPASGMLSNARQFLKVLDISQSEPILASNIRTQVAVIQQQINVLDKDKRIRAGQSSLEKGYVLNMKKWLREVQTPVEKEDDDAKIMKQMGVDNFQSGFRKMWKIASHLDLIISKISELQIVQFLKYDEMFEGLAGDSSNGQRILQAISKGGYNPSSFHLSQIALERQIQLFEVISQLKRSNLGGTQSISSSKGFNKARQDTSQLIQQLRSQNRKLTELLQSMQKQQVKRNQTVVQEKKFQKIQVPLKSGSAKDVFIQLEDKYKQQIGELSNKINNLNHDISQMRITNSQLETRLRAAEQQLKGKQFSMAKKPAAGTYQQALLEEMDKMKKGFERRIQKILEESASKQRQLRKKQYEYKAQNDKIKWQKGLLLKKFQALSV